ncbi:hypothetical protein ELVG_00387 [Emiliania huxleyi virus 203]|nr:hypothetical protein ELVG_00387 [Emiliania huxleyi virus 203]
MDAMDYEQRRQNVMERFQLLGPPPSAMAVDADTNARIYELVAHKFNTNLAYEKVPYLNKRRSSAVDFDVDLLLRMQAGKSCYLFVAVLMIYTSYLRYILEKRLKYLQYIANHTGSMTGAQQRQLESLLWLKKTTKNSEVCDTTLPRDIVDLYTSTAVRTNEMAQQGNTWRPFTVGITLEHGGDPDHMLFSVLNSCGMSVPENNFVGLILKNIPNEVRVDHVYTIRKGFTYSDMTMPDIVNVTTHDVYSRGTLLTHPFIASFDTSTKPEAIDDHGLRVDGNKAEESFIAVLKSVMLYVELFKQKYNYSEITRTHFSMVVIQVSYGHDGEPLYADDAHAVLVDMDEDENVFVFDGNEGKSYPLHVWYAWFTERYIEIENISVAMIPVTDQSAISVI